LTTDRDSTAVEVHVPPLEPEDFAAARSGGVQEKESREEPGFVALGERD
jgi:hypothetical protein